MQQDILPNVIFSPGELALSLADQLVTDGVDVTLFSPGSAETKAKNVTADLTGFLTELEARGDSYLELLRKHPLTFITLARQVQSELIATAFEMANNNELDVLHVYTNEEEIALPFTKFCKKPVVFTHHDPFNFLVGYRSIMPKYTQLNWLSISDSQRRGMPENTNWVGTVHHGLDEKLWPRQKVQKEDYVAYIGRIIEPKGIEIAIKAVQNYNLNNQQHMKLKIAGKHYSGVDKKGYWHSTIVPLLSDPNIEYLGYIGGREEKQKLLAKARALLVPSTFEEPFGMVIIEALACGTPIIGTDSGAIPELVNEGETGFVVAKHWQEQDEAKAKKQIAESTIELVSAALSRIPEIKSEDCRKSFEQNFTLKLMAARHKAAYEKLALQHD